MWHRTSSPPHTPPSVSSSLSPSPSRPEASAHTRTDPTISPIQPPKSNYHGQNRVIKSNGLLDEVHGALQSGTSPLALGSTLFNVLLTSRLAPTPVADANSQSLLSKLFFLIAPSRFRALVPQKETAPTQRSCAVIQADVDVADENMFLCLRGCCHSSHQKRNSKNKLTIVSTLAWAMLLKGKCSLLFNFFHLHQNEQRETHPSLNRSRRGWSLPRFGAP